MPHGSQLDALHKGKQGAEGDSPGLQQLPHQRAGAGAGWILKRQSTDLRLHLRNAGVCLDDFLFQLTNA